MSDHGHEEHGHGRGHSDVAVLAISGTRALGFSIGIVLTIMVVEILGGAVSYNMALLSDAGHMVVDALALGLSLFALILAKRPATLRRTFGYQRVEIMATLINGITLVAISIFIFYEAYKRFANPPELNTPLMLVVAIIGLVANIFGIVLLMNCTISPDRILRWQRSNSPNSET